MIDKEFFDGVVGGNSLPPDRIREGLTPPRGLVAKSQLDKKIVRILTLHPQSQPKFRSNSLSGLDDETKQALLKDLQDSLRIVPFEMRKISLSEGIKLSTEYFPNAPEKLAEYMGADVRYSPLSCDGWCIQGGVQDIIRINSDVVKARQRFTLAHELGHLILSIPSVVGESASDIQKELNEEEKRVNALAADLLLPVSSIKELVSSIPITAKKITQIATRAKTSETVVARRLASLADDLGLRAATVLFFSGANFAWQWPDSGSLKVTSDSASHVLENCSTKAPSPARFQLKNKDIAVASLLQNTFSASPIIFLQVVDEQHGIKKLDEELVRDLQQSIFAGDDSFRLSITGCFGYVKKEIMNMPLGEAVEYFNRTYTYNADRWDEEIRNRLSSEDGQTYIRLRLKMLQQS